MEHSLEAIRKGIDVSEATLRALKDNKELPFNVTQLIEKITADFQKQPESYH
jgi:hypothetical protein